jgi:hypothetical protein
MYHWSESLRNREKNFQTPFFNLSQKMLLLPNELQKIHTGFNNSRLFSQLRLCIQYRFPLP